MAKKKNDQQSQGNGSSDGEGKRERKPVVYRFEKENGDGAFQPIPLAIGNMQAALAIRDYLNSDDMQEAAPGKVQFVKVIIFA